jgi:hypothetical protein
VVTGAGVQRPVGMGIMEWIEWNQQKSERHMGLIGWAVEFSFVGFRIFLEDKQIKCRNSRPVFVSKEG